MMRIVVIGTSGCGKSTFARSLACTLGLTYVQLDELHWSANWTPVPRERLIDSVRMAAAHESWVVDGNYGSVRDVLWPRATHIIWLNFTRRIVFSRILWRTFKRSMTREPHWHGNRESLATALFSRDSILLWSFTSFSRNRVKYTALRQDGRYADLIWTELRTPAEANQFLQACRPDSVQP